MKRRKTAGVALAFCWIVAWLHAADSRTAPGVMAPAPFAPVVIDYYFQPDCDECRRVSAEVIPQIESEYAGLYVLNKWDLDVQENYARLVACMKAFKVEVDAPVYVAVDGVRLLAGFEEISERLAPLVGERAAFHAANPTRGLVSPPTEPLPDSRAIADRIREFTVVGVMLAGLTDGLNPCAFSTLVFLISVLSIARVSGRRLVMVGVAFCAATFLSYFAIGLGLKAILDRLAHFRNLRTVIDVAFIAILMVLAFFSFRDAFRFRKSRDPGDVALQLPDKLKQRIHRIVRFGISREAQIGAAFAVGALVTVLESVCTGQLYVPTLTLIVRTSEGSVGLAWALLTLYNIAFTVPLIVVFILTYEGLKLTQLMRWSVQNVFISKLLMGALFLGLAVVLYLLTRL